MLLELTDITKSFGKIRANDAISLRVPEGALHGIIGENGAGKSTLVKTIAGFHRPDAGEIRINGTRRTLTNSRQAIDAGIGLLHQDPAVFLPMSVAENFALGSSSRMNLERSTQQMNLLAADFGFEFRSDSLVRELSVGERQQLEILRLLDRGARVLILDEPTTAISSDQRTLLFEALRQLATRGMAVLFVTHKLDEVEQLCTSASVLRAGKLIANYSRPFSQDDLLAAMFETTVPLPEPTPISTGKACLKLSNATATSGQERVVDVNLKVHEREVVGFAGLEGSGQRAAMHICAGYASTTSGSVSVGGRDLTTASYSEFVAAGTTYLPADRLEDGLVRGLTITEHVALSQSKGHRLIDWDAARTEAERLIELFRIRGTPDSMPENLSGGNQQRTILALAPTMTPVLLLEHPTRGLDIDSAAWVWNQILERRSQGTAIAFISSDLDELLRYSDRILVFFDQSLAGEALPGPTGHQTLTSLIAGKGPR